MPHDCVEINPPTQLTQHDRQIIEGDVRNGNNDVLHKDLANILMNDPTKFGEIREELLSTGKKPEELGFPNLEFNTLEGVKPTASKEP